MTPPTTLYMLSPLQMGLRFSTLLLVLDNFKFIYLKPKPHPYFSYLPLMSATSHQQDLKEVIERQGRLKIDGGLESETRFQDL